MNGPIDIVLPWVDDGDPEWIQQKNKYSKDADNSIVASNLRFQNWDNLYLWFRSCEVCLPWIHKIFLITCGQRPDFLVKEHPKLVLVDHVDYIPAEYLPTFNSNTIEMNIHRIKGLAENFILFSDDVFPLRPINEEYYFFNDMVCDEAVENIITTSSFTKGLEQPRYAQVNNMFIINRHFRKREVQAAHPEQWFNSEYEEHLDRTKACEYWYDFPGFYDPHMANAMKKSTLTHLWEVEPEALKMGASSRFRSYSDVNQYLIRYWQLCSGEFHPRKTRGKVFFPTIDTYMEIVNAIDNCLYPMISFNENCTPDEFLTMKKDINAALLRKFPNKCSFEK